MLGRITSFLKGDQKAQPREESTNTEDAKKGLDTPTLQQATETQVQESQEITNAKQEALISPDRKKAPAFFDVQLAFGYGDGTEVPGGFRQFCEKHSIYEFWTDEYIQQMGRYLLKRAFKLDPEKENNVYILEAGAGDGKLSKYLERVIQADETQYKRGRNINVLAVDDQSWRGNDGDGISYGEKVQDMSHTEALKMIRDKDPNAKIIVMCSWMAPGQDLSADFRKFGVEEYILIGESGLQPRFPDDDFIPTQPMCGTPETWDVTLDRLNMSKDGYDVYNVTEGEELFGGTYAFIMPRQLSRLEETTNDRQHSSTVIFRKHKDESQSTGD